MTESSTAAAFGAYKFRFLFVNGALICECPFWRPPDPQKIIDSAKLLAPEVSTQQELGALTTQEPTTYSALTGAEEIIMLGFIVLSEPVTPPAIITNAPAQSAQPKSDTTKTMTFCLDAESLIPNSAANSFSPLSVGFKSKPGVPRDTVEQVRGYRVTLVTPPQHGEVRLLDERSQHWTFAPQKRYTGADRAIYRVEYEGKRYTVVVNFWVVKVLEEDVKTPECESIKFAPLTGPEVPAGVPPTSIIDFQS